LEILSDLIFGFSIVAEPLNLIFCFIGVFLGTLTGVLPGLGPVGAMCMLFPLTFQLPPITGIILLAGIYYGAMYGGTITSVLVNIPGEAATVVTCLDGYQMAKKGLAGPALGISAFGSFIAGTFGIILLMLAAPPLAEFALKFGPPEYFAVMFAALTIVTYLARGSMLKAWIMVTFGLILGSVGLDLFTGKQRLTLGILTLQEGLGIAPVVMGVFGLGEIFINIEQKIGVTELLTTKMKGLLPTLKQWKESAFPIVRGTILGFFLGLIPGGGAVISSFASYALEKKISKHPERFGEGIIAGVAAPESANNSATAGAFIPLLSIGIPSNVVMAILLGAFLVHGIQPGPLLISEHPQLFWGVIASMYIGNIMLLVLNLPLIPMWVKVLKIPYTILFPIILFLCFIGVYSINSNVVEIFIMLFFGVIGYLMRKTGFEGAPLILAFILSPMLENAFRQSLRMSAGDFSIFFTRPISATLMGVALLSILTAILPFIRSRVRGVTEKAGDRDNE
jgi:putative tricarboxylic transport membrane protein